MDTSADIHMTFDYGNLLSSPPSRNPVLLRTLLVSGHCYLLPPLVILYFPLYIVLCTYVMFLCLQNIIKNLVSVHQFTADNQVSVKFDPYGPYMKDHHTRNVIVRCNSFVELCPFSFLNHRLSHALLISATLSTFLHHRFGHLGFEAV
jgi:hypothetical protein